MHMVSASSETRDALEKARRLRSQMFWSLFGRLRPRGVEKGANSSLAAAKNKADRRALASAGLRRRHA